MATLVEVRKKNEEKFLINLDLVTEIHPNKDGSVVIFVSGSSRHVLETPEDIYQKSKLSK